ncbi:ROK family transcriptional regulator [Sanguibacter suaedae]|uniref:ROK family transcriptional regulator n=1 Tax=Sanguibacter suaedae TaxID=2795737 RepID=A0A934IAF8_9MICO|nr:ROK family transcriptional regulator [Sanguibacter suaedae]MBI9114165.1 ROK family transcriptional regulator [Sanguibacter suaedae]
MTIDRSTPGSQTSLREANRARIVDAVKRFGGLTQIELAEATGLSTATISTIVKELLGAGVVDTRPTSRSGRRALKVTLARRLGLVAGIQFGHRHLKVVLGDLGRTIVAEQHMPLPLDHRVDTGLDRAALLVVDLLDQVGASMDELLTVGLALPAPVDTSTGMISVRGVMRGWDDLHIGQTMSKRLGRTVVVDNDANLGVLAEHELGAGRGYRDTIFVRASYTTGAGIMLGGHVHRGYAGAAGEIGHIQVDPTGDICRCGNRGCLDTVVSSTALLDLVRSSHGDLTLRDLIARAIEGDPGCRRVIADAGDRIGSVVAQVVNTLNPRRVVVGGELAAAGEVLIGPLREAVLRHTAPNMIAPVEVVAGELGAEAEVMGALTLALQSAEVATDHRTISTLTDESSAGRPDRPPAP